MINGSKLWKIASIIITLGQSFSTAYAMDDNLSQNTDARSFYFLKRGMSAYKNGQIDQAISELLCAANMGHIGAIWKLGHIYADGDGVPEDDYKAYNFFANIVEKGSDLDSENKIYISDALVKLAGYIRKGIPGSSVKSNPSYAASLYMQAAMNYRNPIAQYYLGKIFLKGEGREKNFIQAARWFHLSAKKGNPKAQYYLGKMFLNGEVGEKNFSQAERWFYLSAKKGNISAQAMLGNMLFQKGKTVRGMAMLIAAYEKANVKDQNWIRSMQERAFAICDEYERRMAISLAADILDNHSS
ncbi:tetratricopeptide repeat protein [Bartonella sp. A05]|uniref:tetratricopeptide repeat protein n=1 Tax=Bartonella sp. A05 TaxID=2967261 RepID=UPI0022A967F3|nr:tetratricopeptide repeat protein [Bartonella sp. A05]MCZ2203974.1 sel1 repeat family protein [Bartonella sp. A05]